MFDKYKAKDITISYMEKYAQLKHLLELKEHPERITEEDLKINQFLNIYFEPTNRCNLNCAFCARENMEREFDMLEFDVFKRTIDSLPRGTYITMTGNGEPTLNVCIYDMIKYASAKGMVISLITNASALNESNRKKLINSGISRIQLSFQALDKKTNEEIMKGSLYERDLLNMLKLIQEIRLAKKKIYISISRVDIPETAEYKAVTRKFWEQMPIDNYYEGTLLSLQSDSKMFVEGDLKDYRPCASPWISIKIAANGDVAGCHQDFSNKYILGNIYQNTLMEIVNNIEAIKYRKALLIGDWDYLDSIGYSGCRYCNTWGSIVRQDIKGILENNIPVRMGLVIQEIAADKPENKDFLNRAINCLEAGKIDLISELMECKQDE